MNKTTIAWSDVIIDRFWSNVKKSSGCWEWQAGRFTSGMRYGQFRAGRRKVKAHRFAWTIEVGPIQEGKIICHHCDNPICVRPSHLFCGTHADNAADRVQKGRSRNGSREHSYLFKGELNPAAKLSLAEVLDLKSAWLSGAKISDLSVRFSVCRSQVRNIVFGRSWNG